MQHVVSQDPSWVTSLFPLQAFAILLLGWAASSSAAPAPQVVTQVHAVPVSAGQLNVRAIPASIQSVRALPSAVSHSHSSITHETPSHSLVRAISPQPLATAVRTVSNAPALLRTAAVAQPVVHSVAHADHAIVRAVQPAVVRAVARPEVVHAVHTEPAVVRTVPVVDQVVGGHAHYSYGYSVNDARSGDLKAREETRDGDVVQGSYTVADPDGRIRHVEYTADRDHGFNARVTYDGEPGPVSLGVNESPVAAVATTAPVTSVAADGGVIAVRDSVRTVDSLPTIVRTNAVQAVPVNSNILRTVPVNNAANILRTVPVTTSNVLRTVPATNLIGTVPTATTTNVLRTVPTATTTNVLRTVPTATTAGVLRTLPSASNVLRTVPSANVIRTVPATTTADVLRTLPATTATVVSGNAATPLLRTQLIEELPAGTQIFQDGQVVRALQSHVITHA